jgi:hypothetical protein
MPHFKTVPIFISSALSVLFLLLLSSCAKQNGKAKEKRIKEGETIEIGLVFPEVRTAKNDTVMLALYPHARFFFIDRGLKNSDFYINLIKKANQADVPLRVRVFKDNQAEVAEMIPATSQEIEKFRNH